MPDFFGSVLDADEPVDDEYEAEDGRDEVVSEAPSSR